MDFCDHLVEVSTEFVNTHLFSSRNEDARSIFLSYPAVLELLESIVLLPLRLKRKLIILLVSISIYLIENYNLLPLS